MDFSTATVSATEAVSSISSSEADSVLWNLHPYGGDTACYYNGFASFTKEPGQSSVNTSTFHPGCSASMETMRSMDLSTSNSIVSPTTLSPYHEKTERETERQKTSKKERTLAIRDERRKEQNRAAQRAHRRRKEADIQTLKAQLKDIRNEKDALCRECDNQRQEISRLKSRIITLVVKIKTSCLK
ncbi:hypothetical protein EDD36DRAFT_468460 [Exophiala viscosa]|uniref:BZIP domain-containing protein n=1 Tax=Exophiala viscosa TaxID=2486360 RepID=A0AAN6IBD9_9EURO|nr:hypothetical protein EDD36DRAFT_468460 [Exophiala viscosa]